MNATYMTTADINGRYAYRARDWVWYVMDAKTGQYTGVSFQTRSEAIDYLRSN